MTNVSYNSLERLRVRRPVDRLDYVAGMCREKFVLDIGCLDETALFKQDTEHWLHGRVRTVARQVIGIDNSSQIPPEGFQTGDNAVIISGNGVDPILGEDQIREIETIVAGEFIEHIDAPLEFLRNVKRRFAGKELIVTTPNGTAFANVLLGLFAREAQHRDHIQIFTYKILNTLCLRAGFTSWEIIPYRFYASEIIMQSKGTKRVTALMVQRFIRIVERMFPLLSFGYIVRAQL